jgi:hypothetical protein
MPTVNSYYYRAKKGRKGEGWGTCASNEAGINAKHRNWNRPDSHSGTDVNLNYNGVIGAVEVKNLCWNPQHKCSVSWALTHIVNRFDYLKYGTIKILAISYIAMLSKPAQQLLRQLGINTVEIGQQILTPTDWRTQIGKQLKAKLGKAIKQLLTPANQQQPKEELKQVVYPYQTTKTTQNSTYEFSLALETSILEPNKAEQSFLSFNFASMWLGICPCP